MGGTLADPRCQPDDTAHRPPGFQRWRQLGWSALLACGGAGLLACGALGASPRATGVLDLEDPAVGLSSLPRYRAVLRLQFDGTRDGAPLTWSQTMEMAFDRGRPAKILTVDTQGPEAGQSVMGVVTGTIDEIAYSRPGVGAACSATLLAGDVLRPELPELAELLRPVTGVRSTGTTTTDQGQEVITYDLAGSDAGGGEVDGEVWLANEGGYVVHYELTLEGGPEQFGEGTSGDMHWEYDLSQTGDLGVEPPEGCPPGMIEATMPEGAGDISEAPGLQTYSTALTPQELAEFYDQTLGGDGWTAEEGNLAAEDFAHLAFMKDDRRLIVQVRPGELTTVVVSLERAAPSVATGPSVPTSAAPTGGGEDRSAIIASSLNTTLGMGGAPALPSFHVSVQAVEPGWDQATGAVATTDYSLEADVAGTDVYLILINTPAQGSPSKLEGYLIGEKEYELVDGQARESIGTVSLAWAQWPLQPVGALALASAGGTPRGTEEIEGRPAEVYDIDTAAASPEGLQTITDFTGMRSATGTVWIDSATGALLKADLAFEAEFRDSAGRVQGTGAGSFKIEVLDIGQVTVALP